MKFLKQIGVLVIFIIGVTFLLSVVLPTYQRIERTTTVNAPAAMVYRQLASLEKFNNWSIWNQGDSSIRNTLSGNDGQVGASSDWAGDPNISGEGKITIKELQPAQRVVHDLHFIKPRKGNATSVFQLNENNGITSVTWEFTMKTPRPWNIFNLFHSMDQDMGKDFEAGLASLKIAVEGRPVVDSPMTGTKYEVQALSFPTTTHALIRQKIQWKDISSFYSQHYMIVHDEATRIGLQPGTPSGLIYEWDEKKQLADYAAAIPVPEKTKMDNPIVRIEKIPASKAVYTDHRGSYEKLADAHKAIQRHITEKNMKRLFPVIEQYIAGPGSEKDTSKWITRIIYLVD